MISQTVTSAFLGLMGALVGAVTAAHSPDPAVGLLWQVIGCAGGALTSVSLQPWRKMSRIEMVVSGLVAFGFAFFVTPLFFPIDSSRESGGRFYLMATASFVLIPVLIRKTREQFGGGASSENDE